MTAPDVRPHDSVARWAAVLSAAARLHAHASHSGRMPWPAAVELDARLADEALEAFQQARAWHMHLASLAAPPGALRGARRLFPREDVVEWIWCHINKGIEAGERDAKRRRPVPRA